MGIIKKYFCFEKAAISIAFSKSYKFLKNHVWFELLLLLFGAITGWLMSPSEYFQALSGLLYGLATIGLFSLAVLIWNFAFSPFNLWRKDQNEIIELKEKLDVKNNIRHKLTLLRAEGVTLRNKASQINEKGELILENASKLSLWIENIGAWNNKVIDMLMEYYLSDAEWFKVLDTVPPPRIPPPDFKGRTPAFMKAYREHDYRLQRIDQLIDRHK